MIIISLFVLIGLLSNFDLIQANHALELERFTEQLIIKSLVNGQISTHFQFKTFIPSNLSYPFGINAGNHNDIFPLSLLRLFHHLNIQELHFSLTKGFWKYDRWGLPARDTPPNAQLRAWFYSYLNSNENWNKLTKLFSGQFCASINLINPTVTSRTKISYRPFMVHPQQHKQYGYLAALPQEAICTENLTPFSKMLPCQRTKGLGSLLQATNIFDSQFFSMSVDFEFTCEDITNCESTTGIELRQNIMVVFNAPLILDGKYSWTFKSLFGTSLESHCPLASQSNVYVDVTPLTRIQDSDSRLLIDPTKFVIFDNDFDNGLVKLSLSESGISSQLSNYQRLYAQYNLKTFFEHQTNKKSINIGIQYSNSYKGKLPYQIAYNQVQVRRYSSGTSLQTGAITVLLTNRLSFDIEAIYFDSIPWYLRMYIHTMSIVTEKLLKQDEDDQLRKNIQPLEFHYDPAQDRLNPHQLEIKLRLPAESLTTIRFEFDHQFLRWTEFPPDPNHGLHINPATVTFFFGNETNFCHTYERFLPNLFETFSDNNTATLNTVLKLYENRHQFRIHTEPLIILMPTPDFSMPYNVICFVSTILSIAFGPIYNLTTRRIKINYKTNSPTENRSVKSFFLF